MGNKFNSFPMADNVNNLHFTSAPGGFFETKEFRNAVEWPVARKLEKLAGVRLVPAVEPERFNVDGNHVFALHFTADNPWVAWQAYMKLELKSGMGVSYVPSTNRINILVTEAVLNELLGYGEAADDETDEEILNGTEDVHGGALDVLAAHT